VCGSVFETVVDGKLLRQAVVWRKFAECLSALLSLLSSIELKIATMPTRPLLGAFRRALAGGASLALVAGWTASRLTVTHYSKLIWIKPVVYYLRMSLMAFLTPGLHELHARYTRAEGQSSADK
jgi:hypothetical protein